MVHWTQSPKTVQKTGREAERRNIRAVGGRLSPNSGATPGSSGDGAVTFSRINQDDFVIEHKYTEKNSFRIDRKVLDKIEVEAFRANKRPALMIDFDGDIYVLFRLCDLDWEQA